MPRKSQYSLSTAEIKEQLSIAGDPDKIIDMLAGINYQMARLDRTNAAELTNADFMLRCVLQDLKVFIRAYEQRTGQKIM